MRHQTHSHQFSRKPGPRVALIRGLVESLVEHGRIRTTLPRAKEVRRHVEKAITRGKAATVHARRVLLADYPSGGTAETIVNDLSKRFLSRPGGYTRIIKLGPRPGDKAEMAFLEFVDYKFTEKSAETVTGDAKEAKLRKAKVREATRKRKSLRKLQSKARRVLRAHLAS